MYCEPVRRYPSPSTPMIRLTDFPDDILEEIFHAMRGLMCFPGEREPERFPYGDRLGGGYDPYRNYAYTPNPVPLWANVIALSHVCSHWRSLMLTRPRLWTFVRVTGSFSNRIMVNEMLERAGSFPLSVLFVHPIHSRLKVGHDATAVYDVLGIASVISDHSIRIRELGIVLNSSEQVALVLDTLGKCPVPRLEKLWLDNAMSNTGSGFATVRASLLDNAMPPLRILHAYSISIPWLPYERLVRLELSCGPAPPLAALLHTLRHSPDLEILALRIPTAKADLARSGSQSESQSGGALDELHDEPPAVLPRLRRLALAVGPAHDAAFSVLPHIVFPPAAAVALRFAGRVEAPVYEDCPALENLAAAVRRATFVLHSPVFASLSSAPAPAPVLEVDGDGESLRAPVLRVEWEVSEDERWAQRRPYRRLGPVARLCEGFKAVPLPALTHLAVVIAPFGAADRDRERDRDREGDISGDGSGDWGWDAARRQSQQARFRQLWQSAPALRSLELKVHPELAMQVFASLAARTREALPARDEMNSEDRFEWDEDQGAGDVDAEGAEGGIVCPELKRLRVTWWEQPAVDDLWCVERCCFARASAGARLEHLETVEFPEVVLVSLRYHVDDIGVVET